jgi:hypothetical protein
MLFLDPLYIVVLVVTLAITGWAAWRVRSTYAKWAKVDSGLNLDAFDFARRLLDRQRRKGEDHGSGKAEEADESQPGQVQPEAGDDQPGCDAGSELRGRHDGLTQRHGRLTLLVLERVADLVRDGLQLALGRAAQAA